MARPQKKGLDYFPLDVELFSDIKIKIVRGRYGCDGVTLYIYLLCEIYRNGYYIIFNDDLLYVIMADLNMSEEKTRQIINFLLERSLFNDKLFKSDKVLTAASIQRRYQEARRGAGSKRDFEVEEKFWVLEKNETLSFIKMHPYEDNSENNTVFSENNSNKSENNSIKESKEKKSKVNENKGDYERQKPSSPPKKIVYKKFGEYKHVRLSEEQYIRMTNDYSEAVIIRYIRKVDEYCQQHGQTYADYNLTIRKWIEKDGVIKNANNGGSTWGKVV